MKWLTSPLAATVVVVLVLAALAVPLRRLTAGHPAATAPVATVAPASDDHGDGHVHDFDGVLRVRLLAPAASCKITTTTGDVLWQAGPLEPGEHDVDADIRLVDDALELHVEADFGDATLDTALFLTVLPDGIEEQTRYAIGSGVIDEVLFYEWDLH
jgi:hypothetical protein